LTPVSVGAPLLGNMERRYFPRLFERINFFIYGNFYKEFEICKKKALLMDSSLHTALLEKLEGFVY
jgi:hypothetical protein